jgi:hypothetical protein
MDDVELEAMRQMSEILNNIEDESTIVRILQWLGSKYAVSLGKAAVTASVKPEVGSTSTSTGTYGSIADFFDASNPITEAEKVLVISYWFQEVEGQSEVESQSVNTELKNLGHGVGNITRALGTLINKKPRLVIQTRKSGTSKQARKRYKVTVEGIRVVRSMLNAEAGDS